MITTHNLGFPRIGKKRELKFSLESFWQGKTSSTHLEADAKQIRSLNWHAQAGLNFIPVGDFSLYDHVLDVSRRTSKTATPKHTPQEVSAGEMTKWFDTNYHYIVPEVDSNTRFSLNSKRWVLNGCKLVSYKKTCNLRVTCLLLAYT
ncbi:MAG: 5-methyltetrahydropteroyltriglutamate--homocysteine methyltransferase [Oleispira sp.]|jgi:5-methyltetrahydropteroyltriglutamate--homocysteine methyltransferase